MKKVAILQSNYIPWKGYFDLIHRVDDFVLFDDMQYTRRDWRNRNKIKTPQGTLWLTLPVGTDEHRLILDVTMQDSAWQKKHYDMLAAAYRKAPHFQKLKPFLEHVYLEKRWTYLYELDRYLIEQI